MWRRSRAAALCHHVEHSRSLSLAERSPLPPCGTMCSDLLLLFPDNVLNPGSDWAFWCILFEMPSLSFLSRFSSQQPLSSFLLSPSIVIISNLSEHSEQWNSTQAQLFIYWHPFKQAFFRSNNHFSADLPFSKHCNGTWSMSLIIELDWQNRQREKIEGLSPGINQHLPCLEVEVIITHFFWNNSLGRQKSSPAGLYGVSFSTPLSTVVYNRASEHWTCLKALSQLHPAISH